MWANQQISLLTLIFNPILLIIEYKIANNRITVFIITFYQQKRNIYIFVLGNHNIVYLSKIFYYKIVGLYINKGQPINSYQIISYFTWLNLY